ncbi:hypothetical protein BGZ61DRAFT_438729, partial [Ilyonectria robusta]|uniref:uncharacterized protein n=1 Tax=Ilyonectria robusta TaxID=1079257 RepID=UPI001E8D083A
MRDLECGVPGSDTDTLSWKEGCARKLNYWTTDRVLDAQARTPHRLVFFDSHSHQAASPWHPPKLNPGDGQSYAMMTRWTFQTRV